MSLVAGSSPVSASGDDEAPLVWRGCGVSRKAFMEACAAHYEAEHGVPLDLSGGGATLGIRTVGEGAAHLGGTCRGCLAELGECERPLCLSLVAWDALVAIVHPDNPLRSLSRDQLRRVLRQEITDWAELGGAPGKIVVIARKERTSGVGLMMRRLVLGDDRAPLGRRVVLLNSSGPVEEMVEKVPGAIAISGVSSAKQRRLRILEIDGVAASPRNIASARYPFFRPLFLAHHPDPDPRTGDFLRWILSPAGQSIIADRGTVNLDAGLELSLDFDAWSDPAVIRNLESLRAEARARRRSREADEQRPPR